MKTNIAVIGAGYWGKKHVDEYTRLDKANIAMVCDIDKNNLEFCRKAYNVNNTTNDINDIIKSNDIQAVSVCTPNETHYNICKMILESGKHVLVEKPITLKSEEAYDLVDIAKDMGVKLSVGHLFRFNSAIMKVRELIKNNFFGELGIIKIQWTHLREPIKGRDILFDLAPHPFDILNFILNKWPNKITCRAGMFRRNGPEEWAYIIADFNQRLTAHIEINWLIPGKKRELVLTGLNKAVKVNCLEQDVVVFESEYEYKMDIKRSNTIGDELNSFLNTIKGKQISENDGLVGAKTIEMIEKCFDSRNSNRTVGFG